MRQGCKNIFHKKVKAYTLCIGFLFIFVFQQTFINMANVQKVQRLTFVKDAGKDKNNNFLGLYRCECGNERIYANKEVRSMRKTACGCRRAKEFNQYTKTHGLRSHAVYNVWKLMKQRCTKEYDASYKDYGGRGIRICDEWFDLSKFVAWAEANGYEPGLQLDRINNDGNYEPNNCRFVTQKENSNNRRNNRFLEFNGKRQTVQQWADELGINSSVIRMRIDRRGYSAEAALTKPTKYK